MHPVCLQEVDEEDDAAAGPGDGVRPGNRCEPIHKLHGKTGYELPLIKAMAQCCSADIVASGGAGTMEHFLEAAQAGATVLLAASVFHFHMIDIPELKKYLQTNGVNVIR